MKSSASPILRSLLPVQSECSKGVPVWLVFTAAAIFGAVLSLLSGQDINWDWRNYHDYNVWALLNGRLWIDVAPAGIQTYLNPFILLPDFLLRNYLPLPFGAMVTGAVQSLSLGFVWLVSMKLFKRTAFALASTIVAAAGPMFRSELGTSFPDLLSAIPIIAAVYLLVSDEGKDRSRMLSTGILIGAAVGLKLSNAPFAIGMVAAVLFLRDLRAVLWLCVGGTIGGLVSAGPWAFVMWREFGSPLFPFYNKFFGSPDAPPTNFLDSRFFPDGIGEWLAYPFLWLDMGLQPTAEVPFRDMRFAVIAILLPLTVGVRINKGHPLFSRIELSLIVFLLVSYVIWSLQFSIQRYMVSIELLAGTLIVLLLSRSIPTLRPSVLVLFTVVVALLCAPGKWGRLSWKDPYLVPVNPGALTEPATFFMLDVPTAYIVRHFPQGSRFYSVATRQALPLVEGGFFDKRIKEGLAAPLPGGIWTIGIQGSRNNIDALDQYHLKVSDPAECVTVPGPRESLELCRIIRVDH